MFSYLNNGYKYQSTLTTQQSQLTCQSCREKSNTADETEIGIANRISLSDSKNNKQILFQIGINQKPPGEVLQVAQYSSNEVWATLPPSQQQAYAFKRLIHQIKSFSKRDYKQAKME